MYGENQFDWLSLKFSPILTAFQLLRAVKMSEKKIDLRNWLRNSKPNCMPKVSLIDRVWNSALFWQLISCYELSSCHRKFLTPEIDWGIANLSVCQKSVWLVEFQILPFFDSSSVVMSCQVVLKNFDFRNWLRDSKSNCMPKISLIGWVWNSALFWQLISCCELSSCHKKILTS